MIAVCTNVSDHVLLNVSTDRALEVAGSTPARRADGQVVDSHVPLSPSSIIWYRPIGSDAVRLVMIVITIIITTTTIIMPRP